MGWPHALKVDVLNRGGLADTRGCNIAYDGAVTTNGKKSAEAVVAVRESVKGRTVKSFRQEEKSRHVPLSSWKRGNMMVS